MEAMEEDTLEDIVEVGLVEGEVTADLFQSSNAPRRMKMNVPLRTSRAVVQESCQSIRMT